MRGYSRGNTDGARRGILDDLIETGVLPVPSYEGAELRVLTGAATLLRKHHPVLFIATHGPEIHLQCCTMLTGIGYELLPLEKEAIDQTEEFMALVSRERGRPMSSMRNRALVVIETHPIQYHAPVYRALQSQFGIPVTAIYGSDFSVSGYRDREFGTSICWDTDLLSGYTSRFLSRVSTGGPCSAERLSARGLGQALREVSPAAVLLTGYDPAFYRAAVLTTLHSRYPMVFRAETTDHARDRSTIKSWARSSALRWLYGACTRLLYVGHQSHQHFRQLGNSDRKLLFSPYCVDTGAFQCGEDAYGRLRRVTREELGITETERVLLFSGKLCERKGPDLLIRAAQALSEIHEKLTVLFLGSGELQAQLERLAEGAPRLKARFVGFQNQTQLSPYYHAADLLVLPSRHSETWGLVVNEALHHGLPCAVSEAVGCSPDLIEPGVTGEIAKTGSVESLAATIQKALALVGRPEIRNRCREKVSGYSVEKAAAGIAEAYWAVVERY